MKRRGVLVGAAGLLGGCTSAFRERRPPSKDAWQWPNLFFEFDPLSPTAVEITVVGGNGVDATDGLDVLVSREGADRLDWVSPARPAQQSLPLEVGDTLIVTSTEPGGTIRVLAQSVEGGVSFEYDQYTLPSPSTPTGDRQ
jgi:hypothetical protein